MGGKGICAVGADPAIQDCTHLVPVCIAQIQRAKGAQLGQPASEKALCCLLTCQGRVEGDPRDIFPTLPEATGGGNNEPEEERCHARVSPLFYRLLYLS